MARILVVDDEKDVVELLKFLLEKDGYQVTTAFNGREGLAAATEQKPDLVLLDVMMPKKSGFEVCEILRADTAFAHLKIIMLTAKGRDTEQAKGLALGADAYMLKPFATKDLVAKIREVLA